MYAIVMALCFTDSHAVFVSPFQASLTGSSYLESIVLPWSFEYITAALNMADTSRFASLVCSRDDCRVLTRLWVVPSIERILNGVHLPWPRPSPCNHLSINQSHGHWAI